MRLGWLFSALCLVAAAATACAPPGGRRQAPAGSAEGQPRSSGAAEAVVDVAPAAALERTRSALVARGFSISGIAGRADTLEATSAGQASPDWATCPRITMRDPFNEAFRRSQAAAGEVSTRVTVSATPAAAAGGSRVAIRALSLGTYLNPYTGTPQQGACQSTGALERELLEAVRAAATG
jgi:hypothetical protein